MRGCRGCFGLSVIAVITTIITTVAIIAVVVISRRRWLGSICMGSPWQRGARGSRSGTWPVWCAAAEQSAWAASAAGYAKAIGVARSDLEHCADLQATLAEKINQRCSITVIRWIGILCLADQVR